MRMDIQTHHHTARFPRQAHGAHPVVARVVLDLGEPERFEHGRDVDGEAAAQALLESVPAARGVALGARPGLDRAVGGGLLLVGAAERHPVAVRLQHRVEVIDAAQVIAKLGLADPDDERGRVERLVAEGLELRGLGRRLEDPRGGARALATGAVIRESVTESLPMCHRAASCSAGSTMAPVALEARSAGRPERGALGLRPMLDDDARAVGLLGELAR